MGRIAGFQKPPAPVGLPKDALRGGICFGLLLALLLWGLAWWLALILTLLAYAGLWLLVPPAGARQWRRGHVEDEDYAACLALQQEIEALAARIDDPQTGERIGRIVAWIERLLAAMAEDGKERAAAPLLALIRLTADLLAAYAKLARRGFDGAELRERVDDNLATLEGAYERFWVRLNRDTVVNLTALGESIDFNLNELSASHGRGATP